MTEKNKTINYGFKAPVIDETHYKFGAGQVPQVILQPNGQWDDFLPIDEFQNFGYETYACVSFGTLNCVETLIKRILSLSDNFSDRFLAKNSGTATGGNDPQTVSESLRHDGVLFQPRWDITSDIDTFEKFYADIPDSVKVYTKPDFLDQFNFMHEWVYSGITENKDSLIMEALKFSPVGASVPAWYQNSDGLYYRPQGAEDNHWIAIYGYVWGKYWKIFDSYDNSHKKVVWNMDFGFAKRYHIEKKSEQVKKNKRLGIVQILENFLHKIWPTL